MPLGGSIGELAGELLRSLFSTVGSYIIGPTLVALILVYRASFSFIEARTHVRAIARQVGDKGIGGLRALLAAWSGARAIEASAARTSGKRRRSSTTTRRTRSSKRSPMRKTARRSWRSAQVSSPSRAS
jgi:hypothetical protein